MRPRILLTMTALIVAILAGSDAAAQRQRWPTDSSDQGDAQATGRTAAPRNDPAPQAAPPPPPPAPAATTRSTPAAAEPAPAPQRRAEPREGSRDRGDNPQTGVAVPRRGPAPRPGDRDRDVYVVAPRGYNSYYYPRRYYPYGYGAFGLGYFYYDPYTWSPYGYDPYYRFNGYGYGYPTGELRLLVKPREAEVYVDGYYAGQVDDFDGILQSLRLEEGPYSIEIAAPGYAPLEFDVRVQPGRKITYRGELLPARRP